MFSSAYESLIEEKEESLRFNRLFIQRTIKLISIIFKPGINSVLPLYILLLLISAVSEVLVYYSGITTSLFYLELNNKSLDGFKHLLLKTTLLFIAISITNASVKFISGIFAIRSRKRLTAYVQTRYVYPPNNLYHVANSDIDNPDQRITQDVDRWGECVRIILEKLVIDPFLVGYYTYQVASLNNFNYTGPLIIYAYFLITLLFCKLLLVPIITLIYNREKYEGDFRTAYIRVGRMNSTSITLLRGNRFEHSRLTNLLDSLLGVQKQVLWKSLWLGFATQFTSYFGGVVSFIVIAVPIFNGVFDGLSGGELSAVISQNTFMSMIYRFTMITDLSVTFSELFGYTARIGQLIDFLDTLGDDNNRDLSSISSFPGKLQNSKIPVIINNLTIPHPNPLHPPLITNLSLTISKNMYIKGPNGVGKSTLLQQLFFTLDNKYMFIPQKPYIPSNSTIEQVLGYGCTQSIDGVKHFPKEDIWRALNKVSLLDFDVGNLSPGQVQRLLIAKVLLWMPEWCFFDEGLSSVDYPEELVRILEESGVGLVMVCHNDLQRVGWGCLEVLGDGEWRYID